MSTFEVSVCKIDAIEKHSNADSIEIVKIGGYQTLQPIGKYTKGQLVAYIPADAILPDLLIEEMGLTGKLGGSKKNRVQPVRLRGVYSEGLVLPAQPGWKVGQDVAEDLGIKKHVVEVPEKLRGQIAPQVQGKYGPKLRTLSFDVEALAKHPDFFEGKEIEVTEKIHGTNLQIGLFPDDGLSLWTRLKIFVLGLFGKDTRALSLKNQTVTSKGFAKKGLCRKLIFNEMGHATDTYWRAALSLGIFLPHVFKTAMKLSENTPVFLIGEIFGPGIQKGFPYGESVQTRIFDVYKGTREKGKYLTPDEARRFITQLNVAGARLEWVPVLYRGPWDEEKVRSLVDGSETISGRDFHIREGVVVCDVDTNDKKKFVSEIYKLRNVKDGTDFE